jgi:deoxycytidylate deaminase
MEYKQVLDQCKSISRIGNPDLSFKHGAMLIKNDKIIGYGTNHFGLNHQIKQVESILGVRLSFASKSSIHAEVHAFLNLNLDPKLIKGSTLVVYGESRAGNTVKSKPCRNCWRLAEFLGIKIVVYSNRDKSYTVEEI